MKYKDIQWEDDDTEWEEEKSTKKSSQQIEDEDFASLLAQSEIQDTHLEAGEKVQGTLVSINEQSDTVLIELDPQHTGVMDRSQILNDKGEQEYYPGDSINAYVISRRGGEILLSTSLSQSAQSRDDLRLAQQNQVPVRGKVTGENPGGFDVQIMGHRCFCPVSQMDLRYIQIKAEYVGREFEFLIEKIEEGGRNIVVSRSKLLQQEAQRKIAELENQLDQDVILQGTVTEVRDYGAFIDLGGIEGFLHVSEMSYARISRASDFLAKGDTVRVKVLKIEERDNKKRISLSIKAVEEDPWDQVQSDFAEGGSYRGRVVRLEPYGAFVELKPGIEGLLHISEMSWEKRVHQPSDILKVGDQVNVRVLNLDSARKKISLSLKHIEDDPWKDIDHRLPVGQTVKGQVQSLKGFGAIVQLDSGVTGLVPLSTLKKAFGEAYRKKSSPPKELDVTVQQVNPEERKILLSLKGVEDDHEGQQESFREYADQRDREPKTAASQRGTFGDLLAAKLKNQK
jgi:small subunit ribosomal protein S1